MGKEHETVPQVYLGIRSDIETLLSEFTAKASLKMHDFRAVFRHQRFQYVFHGKMSSYEILERILQMAATYMHPLPLQVGPVYDPSAPITFNYERQVEMAQIEGLKPRPLLERVFGIFLTYSLYFIQPSDFVAQVRVTPLQVMEITHLAKILKQERHVDALAALMKLTASKAFCVVAFENAYDPTNVKRWELSQDDYDTQVLPTKSISAVAEIVNGPLLQKLNIFSKHHPELNLGNEIEAFKDIAAQGIESFNAVSESLITGEAEQEETCADIKLRAYTGAIPHSRHQRYLDPSNVPGQLSAANLLALHPNGDDDEDDDDDEQEEEEVADEQQPGPSHKQKSPRKRKSKKLDAAEDGESPNRTSTSTAELLESLVSKEDSTKAPVQTPAAKRSTRLVKKETPADVKLSAEVLALVTPSKTQKENEKMLKKLRTSYEMLRQNQGDDE